MEKLSSDIIYHILTKYLTQSERYQIFRELNDQVLCNGYMDLLHDYYSKLFKMKICKKCLYVIVCEKTGNLYEFRNITDFNFNKIPHKNLLCRCEMMNKKYDIDKNILTDDEKDYLKFILKFKTKYLFLRRLFYFFYIYNVTRVTYRFI